MAVYCPKVSDSLSKAPSSSYIKCETVTLRVSVLDKEKMIQALNLMTELKAAGFEIIGCSGWGGDETQMEITMGRKNTQTFWERIVDPETILGVSKNE